MGQDDTRLRAIIESLRQNDGWRADRSQTVLPKHRKMAGGAFLFLRGAAPLMYADIAAGRFNLPPDLERVPLTMIMGDCHPANFGFFTEEGSHGDRVVFSANDFDDACVGFAHWDLARFLVGLLMCQQQAQVGDMAAGCSDDAPANLSPESLTDSMDAFLDAYLLTCAQCRDDRRAVYRASHDFADSHILARAEKKAIKRAAGGHRFLTKSTLAKEVDVSCLPLRFKDNPARVVRLAPELYEQLEQALAPYVDDCILDMVQRLNAGTGSVNMARYYLLVGPRRQSLASLNLCHIVEVKQQRQAAPLGCFAGLSAINRLTPAHLTARCQRQMQRSADLVLDDLIWRGQHYLVRSRHHARVSVDPLALCSLDNQALNQYASACGEALARIHCRGDRRSNEFEWQMTQQLPAQRQALVQACLDYAQLIRDDYRRLADLLEPESEHG
ncbi:DUF2252 family protein [Shewanella sp. GXUN23E]|uniref:DUF2252 family protein n=1 Tax=Shewanella sp. GXUN23E TaxID=3422498 RepID=UPI003D7CF66D